MPETEPKVLSQPIFHEPAFSEDKPLPDPTGFETKHPSDDATYKQIENLLKKDVVGIRHSRVDDDELFGLGQAYGAHGAEVLAKIKKTGKIIFHSCGDSGAANTRVYADELRVADQLSLDCARSNATNRPAFLFHLGDVVYNFGEAQYYYDQFYSRFDPTPLRSSPFPAITTRALYGAPRTIADRWSHSSAISALSSDHHARGWIAAPHR